MSNIEAPRLQSVTTQDFTSFLKKRELNEKKEEKNREPGAHYPLTSYKACIDDFPLKTFLTAGWIKAESISALTEDQIRDCIRREASIVREGYDLDRSEQTLKKVKIDMTLKGAKERVWRLYTAYLRKL